MNRELEIRQKAITEQKWLMESCDWRAGFIAGAKWADKTMIEKVCNWIKEHVMIPYEGKFDGTKPPLTDYLEWCKDRLKESERVANEFKKAMGVKHG